MREQQQQEGGPLLYLLLRGVEAAFLLRLVWRDQARETASRARGRGSAFDRASQDTAHKVALQGKEDHQR